jgi:hypothetical protein
MAIAARDAAKLSTATSDAEGSERRAPAGRSRLGEEEFREEGFDFGRNERRGCGGDTEGEEEGERRDLERAAMRRERRSGVGDREELEEREPEGERREERRDECFLDFDREERRGGGGGDGEGERESETEPESDSEDSSSLDSCFREELRVERLEFRE